MGAPVSHARSTLYQSKMAEVSSPIKVQTHLRNVHNEDDTDVNSVRRCVRRFNSGEKDADDRPHSASQTFRRQAQSVSQKVKKICADIKEDFVGGGNKTLNFVKDSPVI